MAKRRATRHDATVRVSVPMQYGEALVLYDLLRRYHEGAAAEMVPDRAERAVLIRFLGQLERRLSDGGEPRKAQLALERARRALAEADDGRR